MSDEELLEVFVGVVDTQLLKTVEEMQQVRSQLDWSNPHPRKKQNTDCCKKRKKKCSELAADFGQCQPVLAEVLESEDIQDANGGAEVPGIWFGLVDSLVDLVDKPDEHSAIDALHKGVSHVHRGLCRHLSHDLVAPREDGPGGEGADQFGVGNFQQASGAVDDTFVFDFACIYVLNDSCWKQNQKGPRLTKR